MNDLQLQQGAVLQRAHELLQANPSMTIGEATRRAIEAADVPIPKDVENAIVRALGTLLLRGLPSKIDA